MIQQGVLETSGRTEARVQPKPRRPALGFDPTIPRHWFSGSVVQTHIANGVNLLFPHGERFFIRSVKAFMHDVQDPALREQIKGFFGQESRHAVEHERFFEILEAQGYEIRRFLAVYEALVSALERALPKSLNLATTAAAEHFTATMAETALVDGRLDAVHPVMRKLFMWHAAEEIEHKAVAFDVLQAVNPSYALRLAGLFVASTTLAAFWAAATAYLLAQEGASLERVRKEFGARGDKTIARDVFLRGILEYAKPGFHPWHNDNAEQALSYLRTLEDG